EGAPPDPDVVLEYPAPEGVEDAPTPEGATPAAMAGSPWWSTPAYQQARDYILNWIVAWRHENPYRFLDASSAYINVVDGLRQTWSPPACDCRRLTVWLYGGSTTWGIGQRDDHTIASELARVAAENGVVLDVQNRGITGFTHWMEAERFAWDLTVNPRPDLVVFYDGVNEIYAGNGANDFRATNEAPVDSAATDNWRNVGRLSGERPAPPSIGELLDTTDDPLGPVLRARDSVARYDRARAMSRSVALQNDIPVRYFWQPSRYDRPLIPGEPHWTTSEENDMRGVMQEAAASLPADVVNLRNVLAPDATPMFTDDVHHNERGARIVAEAMFAALESDLRLRGS
ncbi:MAG: SGNH/GDSL hydrolase family protein, partial [Actinomycetes bacterium]